MLFYIDDLVREYVLGTNRSGLYLFGAIRFSCFLYTFSERNPTARFTAADLERQHICISSSPTVLPGFGSIRHHTPQTEE